MMTPFLDDPSCTFFKQGYIILHHISCSYYIHMCADAHPQIHRISPNFNYEMLVPIPIENPEMCSLHLWGAQIHETKSPTNIVISVQSPTL